MASFQNPALLCLFLSVFLLTITPFVNAKFKDVKDRTKCTSSSSSSSTNPTSSKLSALRLKMQEAGLGAYIVPGVDQHGSEYIGETDKRRQWLSGFTGDLFLSIQSQTCLAPR